MRITSGDFHLLFFGVVLPAAALLSRRRMRHLPGSSRLRLYAVQLAQMAFLTAISLFVASAEHIPLFPAVLPPASAIAAGLLFLAGQFAIGLPLVREAVRERSPIVWLVSPSTPLERLLWILIALLAGFGEEISWRGVQTVLLSRYTTSLLAASTVAVIMFAAAHAVQSVKNVAAIVLFAAGFHVLVWLSGSLYVAMAVHFVYDAVVGFIYAHLAKTMNYMPPTDPGEAVPLARSDPV